MDMGQKEIEGSCRAYLNFLVILSDTASHKDQADSYTYIILHIKNKNLNLSFPNKNQFLS